MNSILISKDQESVLEIKNFSASYSVPYYKGRTVRDMFVEALTSPLDFIFKENDRVLLLDNISLKIKKGERLGILGNNGCGKTTLCRYVSGMYGDQRQIKINGNIKSIHDTEVAILPELSGRENLEILTHLFFSECPKEERQTIIRDAIEFSDLGKFADVPFKLYSKGMRARLFLSLISARAADLLILDEVFNGADYFFNEKITKRVKDLIYQSGAVIFISHSQDLLKEVCNRAIVIDNKKIAFDGSPEEAADFYVKNCHRTVIQNG